MDPLRQSGWPPPRQQGKAARRCVLQRPSRLCLDARRQSAVLATPRRKVWPPPRQRRKSARRGVLRRNAVPRRKPNGRGP